MAKAKIEGEKKVIVEDNRKIVLEITPVEAAVVTMILGNVGGTGDAAEASTRVWEKLRDLVPYDTSLREKMFEGRESLKVNNIDLEGYVPKLTGDN